ncbi:Ig-specific serine endopeptidase MIP [Mycoplasma sp. 1781]
MKLTKRNKAIITAFFGMPLLFSPTFALISCQDDITSLKDNIKKQLTELETSLRELKDTRSDAKQSSAYTEGIKVQKEINDILTNESSGVFDLRKAKNKADQAINAIKSEIANIKENIKKNQSSETPDTSIKYSDDEFNDDFNKLIVNANIEDNFELIFSNFLTGNTKYQLFASELQKNVSNIKINFKDVNLNNKINISIEGIILEDDANTTGKAKFNVVFKNKATLTRKNHIFELSGLKTSPFNSDSNGDKPNNKIDSNPEDNEVSKYVSLNQKERFKYDNDKYVGSLKQYLAFSAGIDDWTKLRENTKATSEQIKKYDEKAKTLGQDSYENAAYKGFSSPSYKANGEVDGIELFEPSELGKQPSWVDTLGKNDPFKTNGLARKIVNQKYLDIAKQTFTIALTRANDFKDEIAKINLAINHWKDPNNESEFRKLIDKKVAELKEQKEALKKELDDKIAKNTDVNLTESLQKEKETELKKYDDAIAEYQKRTREIEIQKQQAAILDLELKAKSKKHVIGENGTTWILDYQLDSNGYPTRWYLGTNSHVARALTDNLTSFSIAKIDNKLQVGQSLRISELDDNITRFSFEDPSAIRKVFDGTDYLKSHPSDFLSERQKKKYADVEEFVDFAVLEIDFTKINKYYATSNDQDVTQRYPKVGSNDFAQNLAKEITNDYANHADKQVKFKQKSYLKDYSKIDFPLKSKLPQDIDFLYAVGWPSSREDYYLKKYIDDDQTKRKNNSFSLWINSEYEYYDAKITNGEDGTPSSYPKEKLDRGSFLSYQIGYRSFIDKPGVLDTFIAAPKIGEDFYYVNGKRYVNMGLAYIPRRYAPIGGSSGTSIRNQHNELVSIFYASNTLARVGLSVAFRSEGYNYDGLYGKYNLPQYDLIYGGGKEQQNSYREALGKIYTTSNFKTNLFKNGLNEIPSEFKFNNN